MRLETCSEVTCAFGACRRLWCLQPHSPAVSILSNAADATPSAGTSPAGAEPPPTLPEKPPIMPPTTTVAPPALPVAAAISPPSAGVPDPPPTTPPPMTTGPPMAPPPTTPPPTGARRMAVWTPSSSSSPYSGAAFSASASLHLHPLRASQARRAERYRSIIPSVEGTVEGGEEEHEHLSAHAEEQHEVGACDVGQFEQRTQNNDGSAPAVCIVQESLSLARSPSSAAWRLLC
jgi:hypothetical protein